MSVIVKGMEMPKHCYDCPLQDGETGRCNILGITVYDIPKECPLIEMVRCEECKYREGSMCDYSAVYVRPNGYCQWGEKEDE